MATDPLILSLQLDGPVFAILDGLRRQHFPRERNHLAAHLTLFHHLPGDQLGAIEQILITATASAEPMPMIFDTVRHLGRGVAIEAVCEPLLRLRANLARTWQPWLTPQDRQPFRPHVTVQNKVDPAESKALFAGLKVTWTPLPGVATGLNLWWYRGGPWERAADFVFEKDRR